MICMNTDPISFYFMPFSVIYKSFKVLVYIGIMSIWFSAITNSQVNATYHIRIYLKDAKLLYVIIIKLLA